MIAPLRRRHVRIFLVLILLLPVAFALALAARPQIANGAQPEADDGERGRLLYERTDLFPEEAITVRVRASAGGTRHLAFDPMSAIRTPDTLVYWLPGRSQPEPSSDPPSRALPPDAILLGPLHHTGAGGYRLPADTVAGQIVLYSLAHQEVVGQADLTPPPQAANSGDMP
jgi:hypothetical protein